MITRLKSVYYLLKYSIIQFKYIRKANKINSFIDVPALDNRVNIYNYQPKKFGYKMPSDSIYNLGDYLGFIIIDFFLNKKGIDKDKAVSKTKHLFAVGSNIIGSDYKGNYQSATIWGSGCIHRPSKKERLFQKLSHRKLDIRAVRGPLSRDVLNKLGHNCPEIYGDPAILMPLIYNPNSKKVVKKHKRIVIPQFYSEEEFRTQHPKEIIVSMNTDDYKFVIDQILSSEIVYSSSLHGIILAEAYGIPAVFFRGLDKSIDFKYKDYYYSTGRFNVKLNDTYDEALKSIPPSLPNLHNLQKDLINSFPYDLWEI